MVMKKKEQSEIYGEDHHCELFKIGIALQHLSLIITIKKQLHNLICQQKAVKY